MIQRIVSKLTLKETSLKKQDLAYWLSKTPDERIAAVEHLRGQLHGSSIRLQRSAHIIQRKKS